MRAGLLAAVSLLLACGFVGSAVAADDCITDISIVATRSGDKPRLPANNNLDLGFWDVPNRSVDRGPASISEETKRNLPKSMRDALFQEIWGGLGTDGSTGDWNMGMSAKTAPMVPTTPGTTGTTCVLDVFVGLGLNPAPGWAEQGYRSVGFWFVDSGGGQQTDGKRLTGVQVAHLLVKTGKVDAVRPYVSDLFLIASDASGAANERPGFKSYGFWDVDRGGARGSDGSTGSYMMTLEVKKSIPIAPETACIGDLAINATDRADLSPTLEANDFPLPAYSLIGAWDADSGGAHGGAFLNASRQVFQATSGSWTVGLYATRVPRAENDANCMGGVYLRASNSSVAPPPADQSDKLIGYWDVDRGGSLGSDGSEGTYMMALYGQALVRGAPPLQDVLVHASNEATLKDFPVAGHDFRGQWDVGGGGAHGTDGSSGSYMAALYTEVGATAD